MNHQPFEEWLLSDEELTPEQDRALADHLQNCSECPQVGEAWEAVLEEIRQTPPAAPGPGFAQRWEARLEIQRAQIQRRWTWIGLLVFSAGAVILSIFAVVDKWGSIPTPLEMFTGLSYSLIVGYSRAGEAIDIFTAVFKSIPLVIPLLAWIALTISMLLWAFIWFLTVWRLPHTQRSIQK